LYLYRVIQSYLKCIRIEDWWNYILPPVVGFYGWGLYQSGLPFADSVFLSIGFLLLTISVASFGFYLNEWTDISDDTAAGKSNAVRVLTVPARWLILLIIFLQMGLGFYISISNFHATLLFAAQIACFIAYSCPPFRLKKNLYAAPLLDALYSGTIFFLLAININYPTLFGLTAAQKAQLVFLLIWALLRGFRNIILHLLFDARYDAVINQQTIGTRYDRLSISKFLYRFILPAEILSFLAFCSINGNNYTILLAIGYLVFIMYWFKRKTYIIPYLLRRPEPSMDDELYDINIFYEVVLPFYIFGLLAIQIDIFYIFYCVLLILFFPNIRAWVWAAITFPVRFIK
jgi:hypothetical protein